MKTIHAIFEDGVFRPKGQVDLPELSEVEFEPRLILKCHPAPATSQRPKTDLTPGRVVVGAAADAPILSAKDVCVALDE